MSGARRDAAGWLALATLAVAYFALSTRWLGFYAWGVDEGMYLMRARMMGHGFALYRDIWFNHPPLLVLLVRLAFDAAGESVAAARWVPLACASLGLAATAAVARALGGWRAAFAAAALLAATPLFFGLSRAVMASLPALALAMAAVALALGHQAATRAGRRGRALAALAASGLAFGLGLAIKLIALPWLAPLALVLLDGHAAAGGGRRPTRRWPWRRLAIDAALWGALAALPLAWVAARYGLGAVSSQAVGSLATARAELGFDLAGNVAKLLESLVEGQLAIAALGVFALAAGLAAGATGAGAVAAGDRAPITGVGDDSDAPRARLWRIVAVWLAASLAAVLLHSPIWSHHYLLLVFPLAAAAGDGAWRVAGALRGAARAGVGDAATSSAADRARAGDGGWRAFAWTAVAAALLSAPVQAVRLVDSTRAWDAAAGAAIARLGEAARPGDYVITDSPMIAFRAGLLVPPDLCDPGKKRIDAGELTVDDVLADIDRFAPAAVLLWEGRLSRGPFGGFPAALEARGFRRVAELDARQERWLYTR